MRPDQDWSRIFGLVCSAAGGAIAITVFCFSTFVTRAEQQVEANHAKGETTNLQNSLEHLDSKLDQLQNKIDQILMRTSH